MKYALVQTTWSPQKEMVIELYLLPLDSDTFEQAYNSDTWPHTTLLSDAMIFDTLHKAESYIDLEKVNEHKVIEIDDKELFEARLARK